MTEDLQFHIAKMKLRTGDILVVKCDSTLSVEQLERVTTRLKDIIPKGVQCFIIDRGVDLAVLTFEEINRRVKGKVE
jgi:hypothetical protein